MKLRPLLVADAADVSTPRPMMTLVDLRPLVCFEPLATPSPAMPAQGGRNAEAEAKVQAAANNL